MAELENYRKRVLREREEQTRLAHESVISALLPALDNLERAFDHSPADTPLHEGLLQVQKQFARSLGEFGLVELIVKPLKWATAGVTMISASACSISVARASIKSAVMATSATLHGAAFAAPLSAQHGQQVDADHVVGAGLPSTRTGMLLTTTPSTNRRLLRR